MDVLGRQVGWNVNVLLIVWKFVRRRELNDNEGDAGSRCDEIGLSVLRHKQYDLRVNHRI
jgi:hypothetical protein